MLTLLAGAFASMGAMFGGWFGHHAPMQPMASTTPMHQEASSTSGWMGGHTGSTTPWNNGTTTPGHMGMMPGIMGKVVSIDGDTITVTGHGGPNASTTTTYTVDATNAKILKAGSTASSTTTISFSDIQDNDTVMVIGTVSGTDVTAKTIIDGVMGMGHMMMGHGAKKPQAQ